jgi:hypothetical protein
MKPMKYFIQDIHLILSLNDSARYALDFVLDQLDGACSGNISRKDLSTAEKQKLKRGLAELQQRNILSKIPSTQNGFNLNTDILFAWGQRDSISEQLIANGVDDTNSLFRYLLAIKEFIYDFTYTPATFYVGRKKHHCIPVCLHRFLKNNISFDQSFASHLLTMLTEQEFELETLLKQPHLDLSPKEFRQITNNFNQVMFHQEETIQSYHSTLFKEEVKLIQAYTLSWFELHHPDLRL